MVWEWDSLASKTVRMDEPWPLWPRAMGQPVDALFIEGFDPKLKRPFADARALESDFEGASAA